MRTLLLAACAAASLAAAAVVAAPAVPAYVSAAVADKGRDDDRDADARRHIAEVVAFSGVKPGDKVVDLIPGSGYFTKVFSKIVGPKGHVYMIWPDEYAKEAQPDPIKNQGLARTGYPNTSVILQPGAAFAAPEPVDLVFTVQNYHDYPDKFMGKIDLMVFDRAVFKALKPGGTFLVVDHTAEAGSGLRDTDTLHRIDPAIVKKQVTDAGFVFEGESTALKNPADDLKKIVFDKAIRGHTDQFIFKFRKPK
ncbi:methyltransferase [Phenylobacterium sp.]|jgi:predicted methyltransferase|uniref:class I SAM-dependent methyltransferase n=1 Tax=Phenylobacterium sp. TaxID=1871053 RepID=UPI002E330F66|nr:methyltransferase [Phenylobacterium sp.]HEX3366780.1 methyltransferase [Phenylobacterium sp.]